jgi:hypothetical protein
MPIFYNPFPYQQVYNKLEQGKTGDDPPRYATLLIRSLAVIDAQWRIPVPLPTLSQQRVPDSSEQFGLNIVDVRAQQRQAATQWPWESWQEPRQRSPKLNPNINNVPGDQVNVSYQQLLDNVINTWHVPAPLPQQQGQLSPGIPGQSVDVPIPQVRQAVFDQADFVLPQVSPRYPIQPEVAEPEQPPKPRQFQGYAVEPWIYPQQGSKLVQPGTGDMPPVKVSHFTETYQWWLDNNDYRRATLKLAQGLQPGVDNPPVRQGYSVDEVVQWYYVWVPLPQQASKVSPALYLTFGDIPPLTQSFNLDTVLRWYQQVYVQPQRAGNLSPGIPGLSVDIPPVSYKQRDVAIQRIHWDLPQVHLHKPIYIPQGFVAVPGDDPPFSQRHIGAVQSVLSWWYEYVEQPQRAKVNIVQPGVPAATVGLYIIELNIVPLASGVVQLQALPVGGATQVTVKQGSLGFMKEVVS